MRSPRLLFCACVLCVLLFIIISQKYSSIKLTYELAVLNDNIVKVEPRMKYILKYTTPNYSPLSYMGKGQEGFKKWKCPYTNCFVTADRKYLGNITKFDAVIFGGTEVIKLPVTMFPKERSPHQKYIFGTIESSQYYPICSDRFDGFFNWTWTFRLDSQIRWGYMLIRDASKNIIGPNKIMHWMKVEDMDPVTEEFKNKLKTKKTAAAWFVSHCTDLSGRAQFVRELQKELTVYKLEVDVYGDCGTKKCPRDKDEECLRMLEESYYFYLSLENSFSEDYVTEKLLKALKVNVVPIVLGGANYTRFMPDGIYLDARQLGVVRLASRMSEIIKNPEEYANFFRWKKYYSYHGLHETPETNEYCNMCKLLNDEEQMKKTTIVRNFKTWWDSPNMC